MLIIRSLNLISVSSKESKPGLDIPFEMCQIINSIKGSSVVLFI